MLKHDDYPYSKSMCLVDCLLEKKMEECGCVGEEFKTLVGRKIHVNNLFNLLMRVKIRSVVSIS